MLRFNKVKLKIKKLLEGINKDSKNFTRHVYIRDAHREVFSDLYDN